MIRLLLISLLTLSMPSLAEEAPPAEYPYPSRTIDQTDEIERHVRKDRKGVYFYDTKKPKRKRKIYQGVEKPYHIGSDGSFYYRDEKKSDESMKNIDGVEQPVDHDAEGGYYYSRKKEKKSRPNTHGPQPSKINHDGSYIYDMDIDETKNVFYFRGGVSGPPDIKASGTSTTNFNDVYGSSSSFLLAFEYDWQLSRTLSIKVGSGLSTTQGKGRFGTPIAGLEPKETFQFFVFPNTLSLAYKFQIWNIQYLTPYVEGGPGYFTFMEKRSDGDFFTLNKETTKFGGALVATATLGLLISTSKFTSGTNLQNEYGATQSWFDLQYKQVFGLDSRKDFSSNMITGGFAIGF